ncbi:hypothetical protein [Phenylobacterium sp.]|uniref:hypothetical protein n=1 Tax=Phenylobacterium sp. TaxID=1871053 RepID=UPI001225DEB2|nr:hypothetical protein [Phenylobacterium sp.]THD60526.1 MAG: hypothetical protein E8A49_13930 [Phenylobacterium sp.]
MRAVLALAALTLAALPAAALAAPSPGACAAEIKRQSEQGESSVETGCWRLGPVTLGMTTAEVAALIGPPDHETAGPTVNLPAKVDRTGYRNAFYVFPRDLAKQLERKPPKELRTRILKVAYFQDRAVQIASAPPTETSSNRCGRMRGLAVTDGDAKGFGPFRSFAGVREGDSVVALEARLGKNDTHNRSGDVFDYWPVPLTLGVDVEHSTVSSFAIGADEDALHLGGWAEVSLTRDPKTCRITGFSFVEKEPGRR